MAPTTLHDEDAEPIVLSDSEVALQLCRSTLTPAPLRPSGSDTIPLSFDRPTFGGYEDEREGYGFENIVPPIPENNWYEDLGNASGLDTSLDSGLLSPLGAPMEESSFFPSG